MVSIEDGVIPILPERRVEPTAEDLMQWTEIRLSPQVLEYFQGMGANWDLRIDQVLQIVVDNHGIVPMTKTEGQG